MSKSAAITPAILDTVLGHLAPHFLAGANGDLPTARHAASRMLAAYNAETAEELRLATEIVSFSFHALEALSEAATPDLSFTRIIRLRGNAVSLSRQSHKAQHKLDQLQRARLTGSPQAEATATQQVPAPPCSPAVPNKADAANPRKPPIPARELSRQERRAAQRLMEKLQRNQAEQRRREAATLPISETVDQLAETAIQIGVL